MAGRWREMGAPLHVSLPGGDPLVDHPGTPPPQCGVGRGWHLFAESGQLPLGYFFPLFAADSLSLSNSFKH